MKSLSKEVFLHFGCAKGIPHPWSKGKPLSLEHRKKLSIAQKRIGNHPPSPLGRIASIETRKKLSKLKKGNKYWLGKHHKSKTKQLIGDANRGKYVSMSTRIKISKARSGTTVFRGFVSSQYQQIRSSRKYRKWRKDIFTRDNYKCSQCGDKKGGNLEVHHCFSKFVELWKMAIAKYPQVSAVDAALLYKPLWNKGNGKTLCHHCHVDAHRRKM